MLAIAFLFALLSCVLAADVQVNLRASWKETPLELEIFEAAVELEPNRALDLVSCLLQARGPSPRDNYNYMFSSECQGIETMSAAAKTLLKMQVAMRTKSPLIEAHLQHFRSSDLNSSCTPSQSLILYNHTVFCSYDEYVQQASTARQSANAGRLPFDRVLRGSNDGQGANLVFYPVVGSSVALETHHKLLSRTENINYIIRWKPLVDSDSYLSLSGYGVELDLKNTEYLVTNDENIAEGITDTNDSVAASSSIIAFHDLAYLKSTHPNISNETWSEFETKLSLHFEAENKVKPIKNTDLDELGIRAASFVMDSPIPFTTLRLLTQNFPSLASSIAKYPFRQPLKRELTKNQMDVIAAGSEMFNINGLNLDIELVEVYALMRSIQIELHAVKSLRELGLSVIDARQLIMTVFSRENMKSQQQGSAGQEMYDLHQDPSPIVWWNDLEKDSRYTGWPKGIFEVIRQAQSGALPRIRRNLFNVVLAVDITTKKGASIAKDSIDLIRDGIAIRFGILPLFKTGSPSEFASKIFYYILEEHGKKPASDFLVNLESGADPEASARKLIRKLSGLSQVDVESIFSTLKDTRDNEKVEMWITSAQKMISQFGLLSTGEDEMANYAFVNGIFVEIKDDLQQQITPVIYQFLNNLQRLVYMGELGENDDHMEFFRRRLGSKSWRNPYLEKALQETANFVELNPVPKPQYIQTNDAAKELTVWIIGSFQSSSVQKNIGECLKYIQSGSKYSKHVRFAAFNTASYRGNFVDYLTDIFGQEKVAGHTVQSIVEKFGDSSSKQYQFIVNGRIFESFPEEMIFTESVIDIIMESEMNKIKPIAQHLKVHASLTSDVLMTASLCIYSMVTTYKTQTTLFNMFSRGTEFARTDIGPAMSGRESGINSQKDMTTPISITIVMNPVGKYAQKYSEIVEKFAALTELISVTIFLNPPVKNTELPPKRYYRYALSSEIQFTAAGHVTPTISSFKEMPLDTLLTLGTDVIQSWVAMPIESVHDLDNIKLKDSKSAVHAILELKNILVEGHAEETGTDGPPRGVQFMLSDGAGYERGTIVMANLGYFQFQSNPGVWKMELREGRSRDLYSISKLKYGNADADQVIVTSFEGSFLYVAVKKLPGKEKEDVLEDAGGDQKDSKFSLSSLWDWNGNAANDSDKEINIFSVASGHLYERFLRIMMYSVLQNTKHPVKFWLIENFLSPQFKEFLPYYSKELGFRYELITYKWPQWLRHQSEKQRIIWAYKILFLDVIFPLSLNKVIFVDADQIIRADLMELVDLDLKGAPYGYTPFCDSRQETKGFRFWENGYWKDYLKGKPYHISALYVIDLKQFRQLAAGDRLRQQYHMLTADPNSLSNLDQDLPNNMQHFVPIFSLPQEWLWCETWCDDSSIAHAKTIDLCNNPLTKEPKLDRARRLIPEWTVYDQAAQKFVDAWKSKSLQNPVKVGEKAHDEL